MNLRVFYLTRRGISDGYRKTANAESRKPGNEPHVHCPAYNLIRNSSNKVYY